MYLNRFLPITILIFFFSGLKAQGYIHFTQFTYIPLSINPAQTGLFEGSYRVGGLYRSQWSGSFKGYQTPVIYADVPIGGLRKQDWIGIGLNLQRDAAGTSLLTNTLVGGNVAYHMGMDKKQNTVLSFGLQAGFNQRNIDRGKLTFQDGILKGTSADVAQIDAQNKSYMLMNLGVNLRSKANKKTTVSVGLSVDNILGAKYNLITSSVAKLPRRFNLHGGVDVDINKKFTFNPAFIFRSTAGSNETMLHLVGGMKLDPAKNIVVKGGLGYRVKDAALLLLGLDYGDIRVAASYDYTLSPLNSTDSNNGFEIAIGYIGKIFKTPQPPRVILCPRY
jgi:type IX secretion system PorP/SprF family membrane protein